MRPASSRGRPGGPGALGENRIDVEEQEALLVLRALPGVGDRALHRALRTSVSAVVALSEDAKRFERRFGEKAERARRDPALRSEARAILRRCDELGVSVITWDDPAYPHRLRELFDPPSLLFVQGRRDLLGERPAVTVVGSRRPTPYGLRTARGLAGEWAAKGFLVISGLAMGIDASAHEGALDRAGDTLAVLGSGPDRPGPAVNRGLARRIRNRGLLVSEFPPGERARPHHFPRRNRILAALADAVVVVEASRSSGALITVDHALDLGREVLAVPGPIDRAQSMGANRLIRDGAQPVLGPEDLVDVLGSPSPEYRVRGRTGDTLAHLGPLGTQVLEHLARGPASSQELQVNTGAPAAALQVALAELELLSLIRAFDGERWIPTPPGRRWVVGEGPAEMHPAATEGSASGEAKG